MFTVVSRPNDDESVVDVYIVEHDDKGEKEFVNEWDRAVASAMKANPETWMVGEVIVSLERNGWQILRANKVIVTY